MPKPPPRAPTAGVLPRNVRPRRIGWLARLATSCACGIRRTLRASALLLVPAMLFGCASTQPGFRAQRVVINCPPNLVFKVDPRKDFPAPPPESSTYLDVRRYADSLLDYIAAQINESAAIARECDSWLKEQRKQ